jgi:SnoaL-like domain
MEVRRSPDLEQLGRDSRAALKAENDDWFRENSATGEIIMAGTAPGETARGVDEVFSTSLKDMNQAHAAIGMRHDAGEQEAYEAGDAGFIIGEGKFVFDDGSHIPTRSVTVVARDSDGWKMIGQFFAVTPSDHFVVGGSPITTPG